MALLRAFIVALAVVLTATIVWAIPKADIISSFAAFAANPWGVVGLTDLYVGFALSLILIWLIERDWKRFALLFIAMMALGNIVTALWLAYRLPLIADRFRR